MRGIMRAIDRLGQASPAEVHRSSVPIAWSEGNKGSLVYLKSLTMKGFKSFADRSQLVFEPGVSAVVGPNGSGKSNISEAVLWVLGERKASNLRVSSMEELIFSGSSARSAVSVAEVDLVLDNSDHVLPIEFDEVAVTRRMYRSGESEYLINGSPALRRDIIDILHDSGIGEGVHSVIRQGKLETFLNARPLDRRMLIEEAAGTLKHKERKVRASRQLAKMDDTLERVHDVIKVIDTQLKPLERQASRAQRYDAYATELKRIDLEVAVDDMRALQSGWNDIKKRENEIEAELELAGFKLSEKEEELSKRQHALEEKGIFVGDLNEQRIRCQSVMQRLDSSMRLVEEKGKNMVARMSDLRAVIHTSETRLVSARDELDVAKRAFEEDRTLVASFDERFAELAETADKAEADRKNAEARHDALSEKIRAQDKAIDSTRNDLASAKQTLSSIDLEEGLLSDRSSQIAEEYASMQALLAERRAKLDAIEHDLAKAKADSNLAKSDIDKRVRILDTRRGATDHAREELAGLKAQGRALEELDRAFREASPAVKWVDDHADEFPGTLDTVSDIFEDAGDFGETVERLLGNDVYALVVDDVDAARAIASALLACESVSGELSLLPAGGLHGTLVGPLDGEMRLIDELKVAHGRAGVAEALLGDVVIAPDLVSALDSYESHPGGARYVTRDGSIVWPNGKITIGAQGSALGDVIAHRRKLEECNERIESCTTVLSEAQAAQEEAEHNLLLAQQDDFELSQTRAKLQGMSDSAREEVARLERSMTDLSSKRAEVSTKLSGLEKRRDATSPLLKEHESRIEKLEADRGQMGDELANGADELFRLNAARVQAVEALNGCKVDRETHRGTLNFHESQVKRLDDEIASLRDTLEVSRQTEKNLSITAQRTEPLYATYETLYQGACGIGQRLQEQAKLGASDSSALKAIINEASGQVDSARAGLSEVQERLSAVRIEKAKVENEVEHSVQRIVEENSTPLEEALKLPEIEDRAASEKRAETLRRKIGNLGAVNHVAREEFETLRNRRADIEAQVADLEDARHKLTTISRALDRKMRSRFQETFEQVNANFGQIFSMLFPGGTGELSIVESEEDGEVGVEVVAHPRGKKITKLSTMSGGEQSLVALALLFAIYKTRNVPFYILDEVEAALDDSNLVRLIAYLDAMRSSTQLILVTHQRRTMEMADCLYGVTMQASGVTKLVSQRLDEAVKSLEESGRSAEDGKAV